MEKSRFINTIAPMIKDEAIKRGYHTWAGIIAQAICESAWGESKLASVYFNMFGMKAGKNYSGMSVNMKTKEEYKVGTLTEIRDNFRAYPNLSEGISGYFDFINCKRYSNLKSAMNYQTYISLLKQDGWATSSSYIDTLNRIVVDNHLTDWEIVSYQQKEQTKDIQNAVDVLADYVLNGYFGNGEDRKNSIYKLVQDRVNEKVRKG